MPVVKYSSLYTHTHTHAASHVSISFPAGFQERFNVPKQHGDSIKNMHGAQNTTGWNVLGEKRSCQTDEVVLCISLKSLRNIELNSNQHMLRTLSSRTQDVFCLDKGTSCSSLRLICLCTVWTPKYNEMNFKHGQTQLKHLKCINTFVFYWVISHEKLCKRNLQTDLCDNEILVINVIAVSTSNWTFSIKKKHV